MTWRSGSLQTRGPRNNASPAAKRADRKRAEAAGLEMIAREAQLRRDTSAKLKQLRESRDGSKPR